MFVSISSLLGIQEMFNGAQLRNTSIDFSLLKNKEKILFSEYFIEGILGNLIFAITPHFRENECHGKLN